MSAAPPVISVDSGDPGMTGPVSRYLNHETALIMVERYQLERLRSMGLLKKSNGAERANERLDAFDTDADLERWERALEAALDVQATPDEIRAIFAFVLDSTGRRRDVHLDALLQATALAVSAELTPVAILAGAALDLIRTCKTWPLAAHVVAACRARRDRVQVALKTVGQARKVRNNARQVAGVNSESVARG